MKFILETWEPIFSEKKASLFSTPCSIVPPPKFIFPPSLATKAPLSPLTILLPDPDIVTVALSPLTNTPKPVISIFPLTITEVFPSPFEAPSPDIAAAPILLFLSTEAIPSVLAVILSTIIVVSGCTFALPPLESTIVPVP